MNTYASGFAGGALIGLSVALMMLLNGRIAGISGLVAGLGRDRGLRWWVDTAFVAGLIALAIFIGFLLNPPFLPAIGAIAVIYVIGLVIFAVYGRHHLVLAPEEEYAMTGGMHRDPEVEAYDGKIPTETR